MIQAISPLSRFQNFVVVPVEKMANSLFEQLEDIVNLASKALPRRPDGIVCVAKFTSAEREDCRVLEATYERMARDNPATVFLRAFEDAVDSDPLFQRAMITVLPCFDVFYGGTFFL